VAHSQDLEGAADEHMALQELVMNKRHIRFEEVRTEGKLLVSLLRAWKLL
jgi:hypothetical protein